MRIIAGEFRGRPLMAPKGRGTRPTTDRVRESLMSAVSSARGGFEDAVVLDAFAGSGALGLEALSRGAQCAHFFETDPAALRALSANCEKLGLTARGRGGARVRLHRDDVLKRPPIGVRPAFDLIFLDPPYAYEGSLVVGLLSALDEAGSLAPGAIVSYEHDRTVDLSQDSELAAALVRLQLEPVSRKQYGDTVIDLLEKADPTDV